MFCQKCAKIGEALPKMSSSEPFGEGVAKKTIIIKYMFGAINFVEIRRKLLYKAISLARLLAQDWQQHCKENPLMELTL